MSTHEPHRRHHRINESAEVQIVGAALLIALGGVFLAQQAGILSQSANWWVIFLLIPAGALLWNAFTGFRAEQRTSAQPVAELILGVVLIALTVIFIFDPTWSFLAGLGPIFPNVNWDQVWRYTLLVLGVLLIGVSVLRQWPRVGVLGIIAVIVSGVMIFDINWNYVWPLALIVPGVWLLYRAWSRRNEDEPRA